MKRDYTDLTVNDLVASGVHLGHCTQLADTRMNGLLLGERNGLHVFDVFQSMQRLKYGLGLLQSIFMRRGRVLFVNPDPVVFERVKTSYGGKRNRNLHKFYFATFRKLPGVISNLEVVRHHHFDLQKIRRLPQFAVILNERDHHATRECAVVNLPNISIFDSNTNGGLAQFYNVPGNDDSYVSRAFYLKLVFATMRRGLRRSISDWVTHKVRRLRAFSTLTHAFYYRLVRSKKRKNRYVRVYEKFNFGKYRPRFAILYRRLAGLLGPSLPRPILASLSTGLLPRLRQEMTETVNTTGRPTMVADAVANLRLFNTLHRRYGLWDDFSPRGPYRNFNWFTRYPFLTTLRSPLRPVRAGGRPGPIEELPVRSRADIWKYWQDSYFSPGFAKVLGRKPSTARRFYLKERLK